MPEDGQWLLEQNLVDCAAYLVPVVIQAPNSPWTQLAYCVEPGSEDVNVAVRIDFQ